MQSKEMNPSADARSVVNFPDAFRLDGEVAVVTGGGSGLGFAMARCLAAAGARVVITGRREEALKKAAGELGPQVGFVTHDVTRFNSGPDFVRQVTERFGPISILINNAGNHVKKPLAETSESEFQEVLDTHVLGAHALSRAVAPGLIQRRHGCMLFIASMSSFLGIPNVVAYAAAKTAILGMVRTMAAELSPHEVRVNAIAPGWFDTEITRRALSGDPERKRKILSRTPMARFGEVSDIGWAAVYLCSPAGRFITGTILAVDGGASIGF